MIFTDLYKSPKSPLSRLRHPHHPLIIPVASDAPDSTDYHPDLVSKDKSKQKEAVQRHLQSNVRDDWTFTWPPETAKAASAAEPSDAQGGAADTQDQGDVDVLSLSRNSATTQESLEGDETALDTGEEADSESDAESVYSVVSDDPLHWQPRLEWDSELSDDELPYSSHTPFKFDSPDSIGLAVTASKIARKARRRKELRKEIGWNDGLACFEARRNAWTGAKVARIRPKLLSPASALSPRRGLFWRTSSRSTSNTGLTPTSPTSTSPLTPSHSQPDDAPLSPAEAGDGNTDLNGLSPKSSRTGSHKHLEPLLVETLIPVPPPLLPPANPMRASINPTIYNSIYEKVVVNSLQPSCPINLSDMIRACVSGWKRDGEWPPRSAAPEPPTVFAVKRKKNSVSVPSNIPRGPAPGRRISFSFLGGHGRTHEPDNKMRRESAAGVEEGPGPGKVIRRSLQRVLGIGQSMATAEETKEVKHGAEVQTQQV